MLEVLGLRPYTNQEGRIIKREVFHSKGWRFAAIEDVFDVTKLNALLATIPESEHHNLYFTVADVFNERTAGEKGRRLREQWALPFDIDNLHIPEGSDGAAEAERAARAALDCLGIPYKQTGVVFSGNGVQFFIRLDVPILSDDYFDSARAHYAAVCRKIQATLIEQHIQGTVDTSVFSAARLMRLPNTMNVKPNKPSRKAIILNGTLVPQGFDLFKVSGIEAGPSTSYIADEALKNYPKPDTKAVCSGCKFLQHCEQNQEKVTEPQWYAANSIWGRLENGRELVHRCSEKHPAYSHYETEVKIDQALASAGPRTCKNIDTLWDGCKECEHYGLITSPIMIRGADFIASKDFGFRERKVSKTGSVIPGVVAYEDLIKEFSQTTDYKSFVEGDMIYVYNGKYWKHMEDAFIREWMVTKVTPAPSAAEMKEFITRAKSRNTVRTDELHAASDGFMNFNNCVLELATLEMKPHNKDYGFFNVLPFNYDRLATSPRWDTFLNEVMEDDPERVTLLKEFGGYCISGDEYWAHKAMLIVGDGANGKSVYMETLAACVGKDNYSAVPMQNFANMQSRYMLVGKLFNYSEETSVKALNDSTILKTLASGGEIEVKKLYAQPYTIHNKAKLILSANEMPLSNDRSTGLYRRLIIVEFEACFDGTKADPFLKAKLKEEMPGIVNSLLLAYRNARIRGAFIESAKVAAALTEYKEDTESSAYRFIREQLEIVRDPNVYATCSEVYQRYVQFAELEGEYPVTQNAFGRLLRKFSSKSKSKAKLHDGKIQKIYPHVKLAEGDF